MKLVSNLILFFDTETTGKTDFKLAYDHPSQPNLCQIGYRVCNIHTRAVIYELGHLVDSTKLPEWKGIEEGAAEVHKITEESLVEHGISVDASYRSFHRWASKCSVVVAHNKSFDISVMQCFAKRAGYNPDLFGADIQTYCTMHNTTAICKIPNAKGYGFKWPKLSECYAKLVDERGFEDAHNALADVNACAAIFWKLVDKGLVNIRPEGGLA